MSLVEQIKHKSRDAELHWLVNRVITPELPHLVEALQICSNLLLYNSPSHPETDKSAERGPSITLAVSSGKSEDLKGILVRDGAYITKMNVQLKERHFTRVISRIIMKKPIHLPQIITAKMGIDAAVALIVQAMSVFDDPAKSCENSHTILMSVFNDLLGELQRAKNSLQLPTDPKLVFPLHRLDPASFDPELPPHISLDIYISQAEVCVDLKDLRKVEEKPWCEIDNAGKSYVDKVRDSMSAGKTDIDLHSKERGLLGGVFTHFTNKYEPQDYITRCSTYNGNVVMVNKKIEVSSADPVLLSAFTKLDSVEHMVSCFLDNIKTLFKGE
ncbi:hypothetical protein HF325_000374 [Metschnikowia pulcherrima]|uniref:Rogdi leucine zipper containing protein n=1 Tax=Metschnikowia pulcherrima TaxID=27326 RepID=A0A8H7LHC4_9ASCO|nr:hypothetical protein HF325_000374 [Metschnikowia pulcherrima]